MTELFTASLAFPTIIYTVFLLITIVYWLFVILGAVDIDMFHFDADGVIDCGVDGAVDGALDGALDGAAEGAAHGATEGLGEAAGHVHLGVLADILGGLNLRSVPLTVTISFLALFGWLASLFASDLLAGVISGVFVSIGVGVVAFVVALPLTSLAIRPLAPVFKTHTARGRHELIGHECLVSTGRVDHRFGQAYCTIGHNELLIQVRCDRVSNGLIKNDEALIIDWSHERQAFTVEPMKT